MAVEDESGVEEVAALSEQLVALAAEQRALAQQPQYALPFLNPGRLVKVLQGGDRAEGTNFEVLAASISGR